MHAHKEIAAHSSEVKAHRKMRGRNARNKVQKGEGNIWDAQKRERDMESEGEAGERKEKNVDECVDESIAWMCKPA